MLKIKFLNMFLISAFTFSGYAQEFNNISVEDGLSNNAVFSIQQYYNGLIWISTKTGINRFDGKNFKHYPLYPKNKLLQYGHRVSKLRVDRQQRFWANNAFDIFLYNKKTDAFSLAYSVQKENIIHDIIIMDNDNILLATENGLLKYNIKSGQTIPYRNILNPRKLLRYNDGLILIAQKDKMLVFDCKTESLRGDLIKPTLLKEIENQTITAIGIDQQQNVFLGVTGKVFIFKLENHYLTTSHTLNRRFNNCEIRKFRVDKNNNVYIGTDGAGIYQVNSKLEVMQVFKSDQNNPATLIDNSISDIFIDKNDRIWVGGRGLSYSDPNKHKFQFIQHQLNKPNSLIHNFVRAIIEDINGNLIIGTKYGISAFNREKDLWKHITQASTGNVLTTNKILSFSRGPNNGVLIGTYQNGLFGMDKKLQVKALGEKGKKSIYSLLHDGDVLWICEGSAGIEKVNLKTNASKKFAIPYVISMAKNARGDIIAGGHSGVTFISASDSITHYDAVQNQTGSIFCVKTDSKNNLWCASEGQGLLRFVEKTKSFKKYTTENGLPSDIIYGILEDKAGNLWLSTTNGISCFNPEKETFTNYSSADGLKIKEFNYGASTITSSGEMVFGGINGLVIFKPEDITNKDISTPLLFTDLKLFNRPVDINSSESVLSNVIDQTTELVLNYNQNAITLDFTTVNFTNPTKTIYSWKLEGLDKEWSPARTDHSATYTNLKPGKYVFRVKATNNQLHFTERERILNINIKPPFWETSWAYLVYAAILSILVYFIFKFYYVRISEIHAKDKINFFINLAHDIRTPLSLIQSPLSLALKKNDFSTDTSQNLKIADGNAQRLSYIINQLLDFEKTDSGKTDLKLTKISAEATLNELFDNFLPLLNDRKITLVKDYRQSSTTLWVDRDKFETIIFNLFSNAIKYSHHGGQIKVSTNCSWNKFNIQIIDSGLGIPKEQQKHIFKRYFRAKNAINSNEVGSGIGLVLTKKLVELHNGKITFESDAGKGSIFRVNFPVDKQITSSLDHLKPSSNNFDFILAEEHDTTFERNKKPVLLIAEDHAELRGYLVQNLSALYNIYTAEDGETALTMAKRVFPDVILSDVMMPKMDGHQLCAKIKNNIETSHIPVLLITSLTATPFKIEGIRTGADCYLEKPFDLDLLITSLDSLLINRRRIKEKFLRSDLSMDEDGISDLDKQFIQEVLNLVEANLSNSDFSIETFEKSLGMSHANLYRKFKTVFGKTPLDFINQYRLKKAAELLRTGDYNISEVAYTVGFSDPKYFSRVFKKYFGSTASFFSEDLKENRLSKTNPSNHHIHDETD